MTISQSFGKQNPDSVVDFLKAIVEAVHYIDTPANKQTVLRVLAKYTQAKPTSPAVAEGYATYVQILAKDPFPSRRPASPTSTGSRTSRRRSSRT